MKILLIEDNTLLVKTLKSFLSKNYTVQTALTGEEGLYQAQNETYDLIILDLKLPDIAGEEICQKIRQEGIKTPILVLTVKNTVATKVQMLQIGADDYLTKPFHADELQARLKALLRRAPSEFKSDNFKVDNLVIDTARRFVEREGVAINLRRKEFDILEYLVRNKGRIVTRTMIFDHIWESGKDNWSNTVDVHIKYLRDKVDRPFKEPLIKTAHGIGYKIEDVVK